MTCGADQCAGPRRRGPRACAGLEAVPVCALQHTVLRTWQPWHLSGGEGGEHPVAGHQ